MFGITAKQKATFECSNAAFFDLYFSVSDFL